jgi:hypothetical protein
MTAVNQGQSAPMVFWLLLILALIFIGAFGRNAVEWVLMKIYQLFIGSQSHLTPV